MPFGIDSRAFMTQGGMGDGLGALGAALLMAPRMKRQQEQEDELRRALSGERAEERAARRLAAENAEKNQRAGLTQQWEIHQQNLAQQKAEAEARAWAAWRNDGLGMLKLAMSGTAKPEQFKPDLYVDDATYDAPSGTVVRKPRLKTTAELDAERTAFDHSRGVKKPAAPVDPAIAQRKAANAAAQQDQVNRGVAQVPGMTPGAPVPAVPAQTTAKGYTHAVRRSALAAAVQRGEYPSMDAALADAESNGVRVVN